MQCPLVAFDLADCYIPNPVHSVHLLYKHERLPYLFATTFMTGAENYTLAAGLYSLQATEMSGSWPIFAAASLVVSLPILIVFFAVQRHMTSGLTAGGVKG